MMRVGYRGNDSKLPIVFRRIFIHLFLLFLLWVVLVFVVMPWDRGPHIPQNAYELIEGQKAYAKLVREQRPSFITTVRGLNMVKAKYIIEQTPEGRKITFGNVCIKFDTHGNYAGMLIATEPAAKPTGQTATTP